MEQRGFDVEHRSGQRTRADVNDDSATWRDVHVDKLNRTITLDRPLLLDLGAVAKGMAIDMAARELKPFIHYAIDAGGDLYFAGRNAQQNHWTVGIRHPRNRTEIIETLWVSGCAVCTSGDYERSTDVNTHHLLHPETGNAATQTASVTVIAPLAMVADAVATAAFVLGPERGFDFLERQGVDGVIITPTLERVATAGMANFARPLARR
jgi:FAD:protein FMN transferase